VASSEAPGAYSWQTLSVIGVGMELGGASSFSWQTDQRPHKAMQACIACIKALFADQLVIIIVQFYYGSDQSALYSGISNIKYMPSLKK